MKNIFKKNKNIIKAPELVKSKLSLQKEANKASVFDTMNKKGKEQIEYEVVEREILPEKIICPDCGGVTLQGLEFCDKCGGELNSSN